MVRIVPKFLRKDKRKYPIIKDERGKSARARSFEAYDAGKRPVKVARTLGISPKTAYQYHYQWKKLPKHLEENYQLLKKRLKERPELREEIIKTLSEKLGEPEYRIRSWLQSPWGLKQIMSGEWRANLERKRKIEEKKRTETAMKFIDTFTIQGVPLDEILKALQKLADKKSKSGKAPSDNLSTNIDI